MTNVLRFEADTKWLGAYSSAGNEKSIPGGRQTLRQRKINCLRSLFTNVRVRPVRGGSIKDKLVFVPLGKQSGSFRLIRRHRHSWNRQKHRSIGDQSRTLVNKDRRQLILRCRRVCRPPGIDFSFPALEYAPSLFVSASNRSTFVISSTGNPSHAQRNLTRITVTMILNVSNK